MGKKRKKRSFLRKALWFSLAVFLLYIFVLQNDGSGSLKTLPTKSVPEEYIPIYKAAEERYGVPWELLAAHHRVETKFSTMDPMISPVGAEGPMQFMPCTFVGWSHPSCSGLGKGDIPEGEKTDPAVIAKFGGYGVDANGDGKADPFDIEDAIFSAANYLKNNGAAEGELKRAVFAYNHSDEYVEDVLFFVKQYQQIEAP